MNRLSLIWLRLIWWLHKPLYLFIRARVAPAELPGSLGLPEGVPVVYALRNRGFADHAVLQGACRDTGMPPPQSLPGALQEDARVQGACVYVEAPRRNWRGFWRRRGTRRISHLQRLTEAVLADQSLDAVVVPVSVFWGRDPGQEDALWRLLFTDVENPGKIQKFFIVLFQANRVFVSYGKPLRMSELARTERSAIEEPGIDDADRLARKLSRILRVHFRQQRTATLGPSLSSRRNVILGLLGSEPVQREIANLATEQGISQTAARARAAKYADEIAADFSYSTIRFLDRVLGWFWTRIFDGVKVHHMARLRDVAQHKEVIYLPSHRSHLDYLLISYVLHHHGLVPPHIAAGINMNFWPVGGLLRRGGAFYLRRSFAGNALYTAVFKEYLHTLITRSYSIAFFPEGGRSRSGRLLSPRTGMLAMTLQSYLRDLA